MFNKLLLKIHKYRYEKLLDKQHKREKEMRKQALEYLIDEAERKLERSGATISYYKSVFKN